MPKRIQRKRTKGWKMPENAVSVTRPGVYGNPFVVGRDGTAAECVAKYRATWDRALKYDYPYAPFGDAVYTGPLQGKDLACWCAPDQPCHADVLLEIANRT